MSRDRLIEFSQLHGASNERRDLLVWVAAGNVGLTLEYLGMALSDTDAAAVEFADARDAFRAYMDEVHAGRYPPGQSGTGLMDAEHRAYFLLQYRVETFYVFARVLLDDVAGLIDRVLAPNRIMLGKHSGLAKHLPAVGAERGLVGHAEVHAQAQALSVSVVDFRDDHVVHRSAKNPRVTKQLNVDAGGRVLMSYGGLMIPRDGEQPTFNVVGSPSDVAQALDDYLGAVMDMIEPLTPTGLLARRAS